MIWGEDSAGEYALTHWFRPGAGPLFDTFFVRHFFDFFIRRKQAVVANCRFVRFRTSHIKFFRRLGPGFAPAVDKRLIKTAAAHQQNQKP